MCVSRYPRFAPRLFTLRSRFITSFAFCLPGRYPTSRDRRRPQQEVYTASGITCTAPTFSIRNISIVVPLGRPATSPEKQETICHFRSTPTRTNPSTRLAGRDFEPAAAAAADSSGQRINTVFFSNFSFQFSLRKHYKYMYTYRVDLFFSGSCSIYISSLDNVFK